MENMISVSRASKLLGITRSELNEQLNASNIPTFEGMVGYEEVKSIAPTISLCEAEILDRVRFIREDTSKAFKGDPDEQTKEHLEAKVHKLTTDLMVETRNVDRYEQVLVTLARKLGELQSSKSEDERKLAITLCNWLRAEILVE
ncbi:MAG: hypothetical protein HON14_15065 [Rhodospirillaceae bacterium]|jgi:CDP-4-dehydro-6-deoxyglucose reductase, E3|nr:hypothetical protein [Rhodospirillaceae bacterium]MBT4940453.1 hypothetical protein [Rhodospirillaceae bacterium]MBT5939589.1 hypothetical protein [Rhodospirillaceae bacterium]MBT7268797.1 hypothetical protein [Rhodospirillaceae bacterium]